MDDKNQISEECPVCNKEFFNEETFKKHIQDHVDKSILNKSTKNYEQEEGYEQEEYQIINLDKIFDKKRIEDLIEKKIKKISDTDELINSRMFIERFKKINRKCPFLYLPYFIEDYVTGMTGTGLMKKYHIPNQIDYYMIMKQILKFQENKRQRYKDVTAKEYVKNNNLSIEGWKEKYEIIVRNCKIFGDEIKLTILYNMLQAQIILSLMDNALEKNELINECMNIKNNFDIFRFTNTELENSFSNFINKEINEKITELIYLLEDENIIIRNRYQPKKLEINFNINKLKDSIVFELKQSNNKLQRNIMRTLMLNQYPALRLLPGLGLYSIALNELENENVIHLERSNQGWREYEIFLTEEFLRLDNKIRTFDDADDQIPFMGRKITPERFILELNELEKGDFDDADDQVTRLAGLVLAESVKIQAPHEKIEEFDFTIDIKNYDFRPDQIEAIDTLDFQINAEIMHVKVMIDEVLNLKKYEELKKKVPQNEQGVIITFRKIPQNVKQAIQDDKTIQTIDEEGVRIWVSITPRIPARVNSISKITFDPLSKLEKKIVRVNSVLYEKGIALVDVFPEMNEETVLARTLEEVEFLEVTPQTFNEYSEHYHEFLDIMHEISNESELIEAYFTNPIKDADVSSGKIRSSIKFENDQVTINLDEKEKLYKCVTCSCLKWQENKSELCKHLITGIDYLVRNSEFLDDTWDESYNKIRQLLSLFLEDNIKRDLDNIIYEIEDDKKEMILDYVSKIIKS